MGKIGEIGEIVFWDFITKERWTQLNHYENNKEFKLKVKVIASAKTSLLVSENIIILRRSFAIIAESYLLDASSEFFNILLAFIGHSIDRSKGALE